MNVSDCVCLKSLGDATFVQLRVVPVSKSYYLRSRVVVGVKMDFEMQLHNEDSNSCSAKKKRRNRKTKVSCGSNNTHHEGDSLVQDVHLQKDSHVESTANVISNSGLIEVQSNSDMNCSENKKVKKEKWKTLKARKAVNKDVGLQEVASETKTTPFKMEAPVDESIKPVSEKDSCVEPTEPRAATFRS